MRRAKRRALVVARGSDDRSNWLLGSSFVDPPCLKVALVVSYQATLPQEGVSIFCRTSTLRVVRGGQGEGTAGGMSQATRSSEVLQRTLWGGRDDGDYTGVSRRSALARGGNRKTTAAAECRRELVAFAPYVRLGVIFFALFGEGLNGSWWQRVHSNRFWLFSSLGGSQEKRFVRTGGSRGEDRVEN